MNRFSQKNEFSGRELKTHFAPAARLDHAGIQQDIARIENNPVIDGLLNFVGGILAVLNEERQILAVNTAFLRFLGLDNAEEALGLRPGEAVRCIHSHEMEAGCGTSEFCSSCGAAIAIVSSLKTLLPVERKCALTIGRNGVKQELLLKVRSLPIAIEGETYLVLFLSDITGEQQAAVLERVFFHDINNTVCAILGNSQLLSRDAGCDEALIREINTAALHLAREVAIQRSLFRDSAGGYRPVYQQISASDIIEDLRGIFSGHPAAKNRELILPLVSAEISLTTDRALVVRILVNMIKNALEATGPGGHVSLSVECISHSIAFSVWNEGCIPRNIQKRIFQRNFSTKDGVGRGLGTYSMKYFGERILGGCVDFSSSAAEGTRFRLTLNSDAHFHPGTGK